jgi:hypothetical protein
LVFSCSAYNCLWLFSDQRIIGFGYFMIIISFLLIAWSSHCQFITFWLSYHSNFVIFWSPYQFVVFWSPDNCLWSFSDHHILVMDRFLVIISFTLFSFCQSIFSFVNFLITKQFHLILITLSSHFIAFRSSYHCLWSLFDQHTIAFGGFIFIL